MKSRILLKYKTILRNIKSNYQDKRVERAGDELKIMFTKEIVTA